MEMVSKDLIPFTDMVDDDVKGKTLDVPCPKCRMIAKTIPFEKFGNEYWELLADNYVNVWYGYYCYGCKSSDFVLLCFH